MVKKSKGGNFYLDPNSFIDVAWDENKNNYAKGLDLKALKWVLTAGKTVLNCDAAESGKEIKYSDIVYSEMTDKLKNNVTDINFQFVSLIGKHISHGFGKCKSWNDETKTLEVSNFVKIQFTENGVIFTSPYYNIIWNLRIWLPNDNNH